MDRAQLEHVIKAAGDVLGEDALLVLGSQAILGAFPEGAPRAATRSIEVDIAAFEDPDDDKAMRINGAIGEDTRFHESFGYYAEGISVDLPRFPRGWRDRVIPVKGSATNQVTGWCPEPHDVCIAKLLCRRPKDRAFVGALIASGHVRASRLIELASATDAGSEERRYVVETVRALARPGRRNPLRRQLRTVLRDLESESAEP